MTVPASIRSNNPGAMWGGNAISKRWGETKSEALNDGTGQHNTIAHFPSAVNGAAAQFDLWRKSYCNMTLTSAIRKWSGGNSVAAYVIFLETYGKVGATEKITLGLLAGPRGIDLMKAQARWEAGQPYPMTDKEWEKAQELVFTSGSSSAVKHTTVAAASVATGVAVSHLAGSSSFVHVAIFIGVGLAIAGFVYLSQRSKK